MDSRICQNKPWGQHIVVRCSGCNSIHSTKNIGLRNVEDNIVACARSIFDIYGTLCICDDPAKYQLVHDCEIDDHISYEYVGPNDGKLHLNLFDNHRHVVGNQKARLILQSWWTQFAVCKNLGVPSQEDLNELVQIKPQ